MNRTSSTAFLGISVAIQVAVGGAAWAGAFADCVRDAADRNLVAKTAFQSGLRDLIVRDRPELESLATVQMELQILLAEAWRAKFDHLLTHDPARIDTANGLGRFSNFPWTDADSADFKEESRSYRRLELRISTLEDQNNGHPDWPELRAHFRSELSQDPDFEALMTRFQTEQATVKAVIAQCRHD
jgi:hypothetical protein